ncbi:Hypothetical predicted protein [Marmota monax]|uniref:Tudor domain-containing protein n=1 Tax=Marmota monax TaxID=9995 RepID=A0A5E4AE80_MARMO|nr:Hypothetical predicted protein [Marmota monax]
MEQFCSIKIVDILNEEVVTYAVDVMLQNSGKVLDHVLVEMGYGLKPKGQNSKKQSTDQSDPEDIGKITAENKIVVDRSDLIPKVLTVNVGDEFCGVVAHIQTPEDFFCQQLQSGHKLAELQAALSEYCGQASPRSDFYPTIGDICCARFSEDDQWYRASVLAYASEESVLVGYVDYGNFEILSLTRLCPIIPKLLELPMQAIKCVLAGVKPSLGIWTPEAICLMKKIVQNKMVTVKVVDRLENSSLVELTDKSLTPSVNVTRALIDAGFAVEEKEMATDKPSGMKKASGSVPLGIEEVNPLKWTWVELAVDQTVDVVVCMMYNPGEFYCHVLRENGDGNWYRALVKDILPSGNVKVHFVDYGNAEEVTTDELQMIPSKFLQLPFQGIQCWLAATSSAENWKTIELPVNKTVQASILEIINPNLFYAIPDEMPENQEKLCILTAELLEYCNAQKSHLSYRPRIGDACCAKYTSDDFWYRAVVLGISDSNVKVLYADYGNIETLPLSRVQPIAASHLELPFQIIKCSLEVATTTSSINPLEGLRCHPRGHLGGSSPVPGSS